MIVGIDPGNIESGYCLIDTDYTIVEADKIDNELLIEKIQKYDRTYTVVIESMQSYGMTMGKTTIETCYFIGRLLQICSDTNKDYKLIPRPEYAPAIVGGKANDATLRAALENRFGSYDKGKPEKKLKSGVIKQSYVPDGPLCKISGATDKRSAFAVACYYLDCKKREEK
jgi:hypothetical protein